MSRPSFPDDLIHKARDGDAAALEQLAAQTINYLQGMIRSLQAEGAWSFVDPNDATMEVVVRVLGRLHTYEARSSFASWLRSIMLNYLKDLARREEARRRAGFIEMSLEGTASGNENDGSTRTLAETIAGVDGREIVAEAMDDEESRLSPRQLVRQFLDTVRNKKHVKIFRLRHVEGFAHKEIAQKLSIPIKTVSVTLWRMEENFRTFVLELWKK